MTAIKISSCNPQRRNEAMVRLPDHGLFISGIYRAVVNTEEPAASTELTGLAHQDPKIPGR